MQWCVEGGLQNSVWFRFTGPESGVVSIDTRGMDTQIAVYRLDECDSIFSPSGYEMVAANDDYHTELYDYAAAIANLSVTPGATYYIQIDGSAGGVEGDFTLFFYDYSLGIENQTVPEQDQLSVYPNPNDGSFSIELGTRESGNVLARVFDATGRIVYTGKYMHAGGFPHTIDLGNRAPGVYYLEVVTKSRVYRKNLIVK